MNLRFETISDKDGLARHKAGIFGLFRACFGSDSIENVWEWEYVHNPAGDPIVSLSFTEEGDLVGHYAVVPFFFERDHKVIKGCLSMTTMVHKDYRKYGIFVKQASQVYEAAQARGFQVVVGFPNKNSAPGFAKRLGWTLEAPDYVARVSGAQILESKALEMYVEKDGSARVGLSNSAFKSWRLSKPQAKYFDMRGVIFKEYDPCHDIVFIEKGFKEALKADKSYNMLIDATIDDLKGHLLFDYQFGYKVLDDTLKDIRFKKDLLMSDVF